MLGTLPVPLRRASCVDDVVSPSYSVTWSKLRSVSKDEKESRTFCPLGQRSFQAQSLLLPYSLLPLPSVKEPGVGSEV